MINIYGDEDQNDLMELIKNYKGEDYMEDTRINQIYKDIASYEKAIENAEGALEEAERELQEEFERKYMNDGNIEDYPEYNRD